ncbi:MAG: hypothetical protein JWN45_995 [Acidobacteriaceae bacterium]|nr:hypothetical protein [Acidobacteriaceae bacterium]
MRSKFSIGVVLLTLAVSASAQAVQGQTAEQCPAGKVPIMVLGTYHMANPGHDTVNMHADSVSSQRRQKEMAELLERLAKFRPTKIAVESTRDGKRPAQYAQYLAGSYQLTANEIDQVGFVLAKKMGLKQISPVDFDMWMSGLQPSEMHEPKPKPKPPTAAPAAPPEEESALIKEVRAVVKKDEEILKTSTVSEYLAHLNAPERARLNNVWDVESNLKPGEGYNMYEHTDEATGWYKRNLRIATNVLDITEPNDRVLVIFGAGHKKILSDLLGEHPMYCLVDTVKYLKASF